MRERHSKSSPNKKLKSLPDDCDCDGKSIQLFAYIEILATGVKGKIISIIPPTPTYPQILIIEEEFGDHEHEWVECHHIRILHYPT